MNKHKNYSKLDKETGKGMYKNAPDHREVLPDYKEPATQNMNKELPEEVKQDIRKEIYEEYGASIQEGANVSAPNDHVISAWEHGAQIAWDYSQKEIASLQNGIKHWKREADAVKQNHRVAMIGLADLHEFYQKTGRGQVGDSILKIVSRDLTSIQEELQRVTGLLKEQVTCTTVGYLIAAKTDLDKIEAVESQIWRKFCKQHSIKPV